LNASPNFKNISDRAEEVSCAYNVGHRKLHQPFEEVSRQVMGVEYKDYYKILGVTRQATEKEIRTAYRKLAREFHPDVNAGAADRFKDINEAYEALKDPEKRRLYDNLGPQWRQGQNYNPPPGFNDWGQGGVNMNDMGGMGGFSSFFDALFGGGMGGQGGFGGAGFPGGGHAGRQRGNARGQAATADAPTEQNLYLDLEEIASGLQKEVTTPSGKRLTVRIPAGVKEGTKIRLAGEGASGRFGQAGDLLLNVKYREHKHFKVEGDALVYEAPVPVPDLVLGGEITVPSFAGEVSMRIPPGTQPGRLMRLKGQGLPKRNGEAAGDLLVRPRAVIPEQPSEREKALYQELRSLVQSNVNAAV
jgi:curved DNA-binding protein